MHGNMVAFLKKFKWTKTGGHGNPGPAALLASVETKPVPVATPDASIVGDPMKPSLGVDPNPEHEAQKLLVDNPGITGATYANLLKASGLKIVREAFRLKNVREADSSSANAASVTAGVNAPFLRRYKPAKKKVKESVRVVRDFPILSRFTEADAANRSGTGFTKFRVVLIKEGMGNFGDAFYYTREALQSAVAVFEGKKIYADHPSAFDEQSRPERSVKDVLGYFENVTYVEVEGQGQLQADVKILPDEPYRWARSLMSHAVEYSKKFPDKDFIGLSINASGEAEDMPIQQIIDSGMASPPALLKLEKAKQNGIETVRMVRALTSAISCDLVTEAGAGGRVLDMIEQERLMSKKKKEAAKLKENDKPVITKEGDASPADLSHGTKPEVVESKTDDHDDKAQDEMLIKKMIGEYLGQDEMESEEVMKMCGEAYQAYIEMGYEADEALKCAGNSMKLAKHMAAKEQAAAEMAAKATYKPADPAAAAAPAADAAAPAAAPKEGEENAEADKKDDAKEAKTDDAKEGDKVEEGKADDKKDADTKESEVEKLKAENAALKEKQAAIEADQKLVELMKENKLDDAAQAKCRETLGEIRTVQYVEKQFKVFVEGYKAKPVREDNSFPFVFNAEKKPSEKSTKIISFDDCLTK